MEHTIARALSRRAKISISELDSGPYAPGTGPPGPAGPRGGGRLTPAAVLVPVFEKAGEPHVLLTLRTQAVGSHRGQIAFPGGRRDPGDPSLLHTALRESEEEIGLAPSCVRLLGELDDLVTVTDYVVSPYVGAIPHPYAFNPSSREIAEIIEAPISVFLDPARLRIAPGQQYRGKIYTTYFFDTGGHVVWGATARILLQLLELVYGYRVPDGDG